jgi:hypothetical protein
MGRMVRYDTCDQYTGVWVARQAGATGICWVSAFTSAFTWVRRIATQRGLAGQKLREITIVCGYFENNIHRMRYDEYLREGYPIATGVVEERAATWSRTAWNAAECAGGWTARKRC